MKRVLTKTILILESILMPGLASCSSSATPGDEPQGGNSSDTEIEIKVAVDINRPTRAGTVGGVDESGIVSLSLLLFENAGSDINEFKPGSLYTILDTEEKEENYFVAQMKVASGNPMPSRLIPVGIANAKDAIIASDIMGNGNMTYSDICHALEVKFKERDAITFWGMGKRMVNTSLFSQDIAMPLVRDWAKYTVNAEAVESKFQLESTMVWNRTDSYSLMPYLDNLDKSGSVIKPSVPENETVMENGNPQMEASAYIPEQDVRMTGDGNPNDGNEGKRPALIVGGRYGTMTKSTYYRVDFKNDEGKIVDILRNHHYIINITDVLGPGSETPEDAYKTISSSIEAEIVPWTDMNQNAMFDGSNWIAAPKTVELGPAAGATAYVKFATNVGTENWQMAWSTGMEKYEDLEFTSAYSLESPNKWFNVTIPANDTSKDTDVTITVKTLQAIPEDVESREMQLYINVTPRLRVVLTVRQKPNSSDIVDSDWDLGKFDVIYE